MKLACYQHSKKAVRYALSASSPHELAVIQRLFPGNVTTEVQPFTPGLVVKSDIRGTYRFSKETARGVRTLQVVVPYPMETFGATEVEWVEFEGTLNVTMPKTPQTPRVRSRRVPAPPPIPITSLQQAVRAVNEHKRTMKKDLCLSVGDDGLLEALIRYQ